MLTGIDTITIHVKDMKKAIEFYTNQLGMKLTVNEPSIDHYEVEAPGSKGPGLCLCEDEYGLSGDTSIVFTTDNIQSTCQTLKKNGVRVTQPYKAHGEWWAGFKDLDGNSYGLHQL